MYILVDFWWIWVYFWAFLVGKNGQFNSGQITLWSQGDYHVSNPTRIWSWQNFSRHDQAIFFSLGMIFPAHDLSLAFSNPKDLKKNFSRSKMSFRCHFFLKLGKFLDQKCFLAEILRKFPFLSSRYTF